MVSLLDVNVLIALSWPTHVHHRYAQDWFSENASSGWATCPLTQCSFVRISSNPAIIPDAVSPREALSQLAEILKQPDHIFWPEEVGPTELSPVRELHLVGHRQATDAYLLGLAIYHKGRLATLDQELAHLLPETSPHIGAVETLPVC